jgi:iron(III) transport system ATP-binding protein
MIEIEISNLVKSFQSNIVLNNINLHIGAGELFFLLRPSGCGKTTLLRSIAGFLYIKKLLSKFILTNDIMIKRLFS